MPISEIPISKIHTLVMMTCLAAQKWVRQHPSSQDRCCLTHFEAFTHVIITKVCIFEIGISEIGMQRL